MGWWGCVSLRRALAGMSEGYGRVIAAWLGSGLFSRKMGGLTSILARSLAASLADMGAGTAPAAQSRGLGISAHDLGIALAIISLHSYGVLSELRLTSFTRNMLQITLLPDQSTPFLPCILELFPLLSIPLILLHQHYPYMNHSDIQSTKSRPPLCSHL
jgi:hypothetical protein